MNRRLLGGVPFHPSFWSLLVIIHSFHFFRSFCLQSSMLISNLKSQATTLLLVSTTITAIMSNLTFTSSKMSDLPPLPSYSLSPAEPLVSFIPDFYLSLILPIAAYWIVSLFFHYIDVLDVWPQYRLHTPAEILKRNHVSRYEVARDVIIQQIIQTLVGAVLGLTEPEEVVGKENYDIAQWATRLRIAQRALPQLLGFVGLNAAAMSKNISRSHPMIAAVLAGGKYPSLTMGLDVVSGAPVPTFADWEILAAKTLYWGIVPLLQFGLAIFIVDTWQYFLHRAMHMNKWLYSESFLELPRLPSLT
jgi:sphinganine C4-monooxygenase